jgi:hypothetical protein
MFIEITWNNSKGDRLKALVPSDKVQVFVDQFLERNVSPILIMPNSDNVHEIPEKTLTLTQS